MQNLKRLAIFCTVVDQGSFAATARQLNLARSAVSEQVAALESAMGVRLLNRTTRQLALTPEGRAIYERAHSLNTILSDVSAMRDTDAPRGRVRITTSQDFADKWLIPRLARFSKDYPEICFDLALSDRPVDLIASGIDLAIRIGRPRDASLIARPITQENPVVTASCEYVTKHGQPTRVDALTEHRWILLEQLSPGNRVTLNGPDGTREFIPPDFHVTDSPLAARAMIESGMGIGFQLPGMVNTQLKNGTLVHLVPKWREAQFTYSVVYPSRRFVPQRTRLVIEYLLSGSDAH